MHSPFDWTQIDRELTGESRALETARQDALLDLAPAPVTDTRVDRLVDRVMRETRPSNNTNTQSGPSFRFAPARPSYRRPRTWALSGMVAMAAIGVILWGTTQREPARVQHEWHTTQGQQLAVVLPDETRMTLAPHSHLVYTGVTGKHSEVQLQGEAFFEVTHAAHRSFVVRIGNTTVDVLGTQFNVSHYPTDSASTVVVLDGKVAVSAANADRVILVPGQMATVRDSLVIISNAQSAESVTAWRNGQLVFENVPIPVMLHTLARWYGYHFILADSVLASRRVSVTFAVDKADETMSILKGVLGVSLTITGDTIVLRPRAQSKHTQPTPRRMPGPLGTPAVAVQQSHPFILESGK